MVWIEPRKDDKVLPVGGHSPWTLAGSYLNASEWPSRVPLDALLTLFYLLSQACGFVSRVLHKCSLYVKAVSVASSSGLPESLLSSLVMECFS